MTWQLLRKIHQPPKEDRREKKKDDLKREDKGGCSSREKVEKLLRIFNLLPFNFQLLHSLFYFAFMAEFISGFVNILDMLIG